MKSPFLHEFLVVFLEGYSGGFFFRWLPMGSLSGMPSASTLRWARWGLGRSESEAWMGWSFQKNPRDFMVISMGFLWDFMVISMVI